ncbi:MAG TPA: sodium:solute symporter family protein [Ignisphaera sp.]|nr:sodium:solute symporter family protein [Ignisphaera sp.]
MILYLLFLMYIGYWSYKRRIGVSVQDFFLSSRLLGYLVIGFSLFATIASGNTFVGYTAKAYRAGLLFMVVPAFYVSILVGMLAIAARLIPMAAKRGYVTPGDYLLDRYGSRALAVFLLILMFWCTFVQFFEQAIAMGYIGEICSGGWISYEISALLFMVAIAFIITIGGFRGTALANFIMGLVMVVGMVGFLIGVLPALGGIATLEKAVQLVPKKFAWPGEIGYNVWISTVILVMFGVIVYYQILLYILATKDFKTWRRTYLYTPAIYALIPSLFVIAGLMCLALFPGLSKMESERLVPMLLSYAAKTSPVAYGFGELLLLAVTSATVSTAAAVIFALGAVLSKDIYQKVFNPQASDRKVINVSRAIMLVLVVLGYIIVMTPKFTLWRWVELKFEIGLQACPALLLGLYCPWINRRGVIAGAIVGLAIALGLTFAGYPKLYGWHAGVIGFLANMLITVLVSYFTKKPSEIEAAKKIIEIA